jgi:molecular chaperone GrpE
VRYANAGLLEKLLPVVDNFELGLAAARQSADGSAVLSGMSMVQRQLEDFLRDNGLQSIDATGQKFDPNLHEALGEENSAEVPEGVVLRQLRKGWKLKDRLIRAANVFISKGNG